MIVPTPRAFWASTGETNSQIGADSERARRKVISFDPRPTARRAWSWRASTEPGPVQPRRGRHLRQGVSIDERLRRTPALERQPSASRSRQLFYNVRPQWEQGMFTVGATINGTTSSYAQDDNVLVQPGYVIVNPYVFVRPMP
jgi:hypothetical protein